MARGQRLLLFSISTILLVSIAFTTSAQTCATQTFLNNKVFDTCTNLPYLNSYLYWTYNESSGSLQVAYRHTGVTSSNWVAWAINPTSKGMVGSQALVAYQRSDGTMRAYTSPITSYQTSLQEGSLSFTVSDLSATYSNNEMVIFATLGVFNLTSLNQVWQDGPVSGNVTQMHATSGGNLQSMGTLNLVSGSVAKVGGGSADTLKKKNIHGLLNAVSWGIMMPIGAMIARYLKVFRSANPAWFYLHVSCQTIAYAVGVTGWATGLKLGSESVGVTYVAHRTIGIILFCLGTLQVFALFLRPKPDHQYRFYWNIYHHTVGYTVIVLGVINIFKGFDMLHPEKKWKNAYVGAISALAFSAVWLEAFTWFVVLKRRRSERAKTSQCINGSNGTNGYGAREHHGV